VLVRRGPRSGVTTMVAVHSTVRGPALGGCRMWRYETPLLGLLDVLRLSRAMTYKAAVAGLAMGGGKGVIALPLEMETPVGEQREAVLQDFAEVIDALGGAYRTAEDVGTSDADMAVIAGTTPHVTGLTEDRGGSGDPSPWTALGVESAILASAERAFGTTDLRDRTVAVVGLGSVGLPLAQLLHARGARIVAADIVQDRRADAEALGATWTTPDEAMRAPVDVLAPCALGGVLNDISIPELQAPVIVGAANNQLAEDRHAELLRSRGVLWAPDFVANAGGIINISVELEPEGYDRERARERVQRIGETLRGIYDEAEAAGSTPLAAAMALAERRLADPVAG
jgi:leucine dehydrogenase